MVLVQSALELVPPELTRDPSVVADAKRRRKQPGEILLDASLHQSAMKTLPDRHQRGRPDLVHFFLLSVLGTPLNFAHRLEVCIHTRDDFLLEVHPEVRLPRTQDRFKGIVENLFQKWPRGESDQDFLRLAKGTLGGFLPPENPGEVVVTTHQGEPLPALEHHIRAYQDRALEKSPNRTVDPLTILVGGFQRGSIDLRGYPAAPQLPGCALSPYPLEAWTVGARLVALFERGLPPQFLDERPTG